MKRAAKPAPPRPPTGKNKAGVPESTPAVVPCHSPSTRHGAEQPAANADWKHTKSFTFRKFAPVDPSQLA